MVIATLGYRDKEGALVQIPFSGTNARRVEMDAVYGRIQNRLRKLDTYLSEKHNVSTYVTDEQMRRKVKELIRSDEPLALVDGEWVPITILEIDFQDVIPWTRPYPFKITYLITDEDARAFAPDDYND